MHQLARFIAATDFISFTSSWDQGSVTETSGTRFSTGDLIGVIKTTGALSDAIADIRLYSVYQLCMYRAFDKQMLCHRVRFLANKPEAGIVPALCHKVKQSCAKLKAVVQCLIDTYNALHKGLVAGSRITRWLVSACG